MAFLFVVAAGIADALLKGSIMARYDWKDVPDFWKSGKGMYEHLLFGTVLALALIYVRYSNISITAAIIFFIELGILGISGVEAVIYWWSLRPFGICQKAHWKPNQPCVGWFEFPEEAPWLDKLIFPVICSQLVEGDIFHSTRRGVYFASGIGVVVALILEVM